MAWQLATGSTTYGQPIVSRQVQNKFNILNVSSTKVSKRSRMVLFIAICESESMSIAPVSGRYPRRPRRDKVAIFVRRLQFVVHR